MSVNDFKPSARRKSRRNAVQAIYQWQLSGADISEIERQFLIREEMKKTDIPYFQDLLHGVPKHLNELDESIAPQADRKISEMDPVELAILRLGCYELIHRLDVPYKVILNEAIELAKVFGAEDGHKYVNGVLDKISLTVRKTERGLAEN